MDRRGALRVVDRVAGAGRPANGLVAEIQVGPVAGVIAGIVVGAAGNDVVEEFIIR